MKIQFLGAAQTVTGSCHVIEAAGHRFAVDCGMHQGNKAIEDRNFDTELYRPESIEFILLTHAHIDHSGLIPRMSANGFKGKVYCTAPTCDLVTLMLEDSAYIQEMEYSWREKQRKRTGKKEENDLLYSVEDAQKCVKQISVVEYDTPFEPAPGIKVTYKYAAHILGAAFIIIDITENGENKRLTFSGDLGRPENMLLFDPSPLEKTDYLFLESTYGNRDHKDEKNSLDELAEAIDRSYKMGGKVIIPTFAVERAQEIMYCLSLLDIQGKIPENMPIYLDSPLAIKATEVFINYKDKLDFHEISNNISALRDFSKKVRYTLKTEESQALNAMNGPAIILSASGMCNAGRIKHHLKHTIWRPETSIVFVGFQAVGTLGRKIVEGATSISLMNNELNVSAKIYTINGFSAHAGQKELLEWVSTIAESKPHVVLIHGEKTAQETLAGLIKEKFSLNVTIPEYLEELELTEKADHSKIAPSLAKHSMPKLDWQFVLEDLDTRIKQVHTKLADVQQRPWEDQTEIHDKLAKLNHDIYKLIAEL